jgi:1-acyl-sn-glycerol-3-phosphate acyltransferase
LYSQANLEACENIVMLNSTLIRLRQAAGLILLAINSVLHITPVVIIAVFKALVPVAAVRRVCDRWLMALAASWIDVNSWMMRVLTDTEIEVTGLPDAMLDGHCMVISNHQSWVDIPVMQALLNRRLPFLRFFLKSQLFWVPVLGLAWWALDFPFMKRYSRAQIERKPELAGRDLAATRKACEKYRHLPVAIVNFVEGTRFRPDRHHAQHSPYQHLLKPRAGGTAFVLNAMGETLDTLVDVTIAYPDGPAELFDLFANRIRRVCVHMRTLSIPTELRGGDYQNDPAYRAQFQTWLNQLWDDKDRLMQTMLHAKPS